MGTRPFDGVCAVSDVPIVGRVGWEPSYKLHCDMNVCYFGSYHCIIEDK